MGGPDVEARASAREPAAATEARASAPPMAGNVVWRFGATLARFALAFAVVPILTRLLGMEQWGLLAIFQATTAPLYLLDLGMGSATIKLVSEARGRADEEGAVRLVGTTAVFNVSTGILGALAVALAAPWLAGSVFAIPPDQHATAVTGFRLVAINWLFAFTGATFLGALTALQRFDLVAKLGTLVSAAAALGGIVTAFAGGDVVAVLAAQTAVAGAGMVGYFCAAAALLPRLRKLPRWDGASFRRMIAFGAWTFLSSLGTLLGGWSDQYLLAMYFAPAIVGFYAIAQMLQTQVYVAFTDLGEVLFPAVSHRQGQGDLAGARRLALLAGWALTSGFGAAAAVLGTVGGDFLALWISREAADRATVVLRLLCAGGAIGIGAVAPLYYLLGTGRPRPYATATLLTGGAIAATSMALVPRYGLAGAGVGLVVGVLVRSAFLAVVWRSGSGGGASVREIASHLWVPSAVSVASLVALSALHDLIGEARSWPALVLETLAVAIAAGGAQLAVAEAVPGGAQRRRDVVDSFRSVAARLLGRTTC